MLDPYQRYPQPKLFQPTLKQKLNKWMVNKGIIFIYLIIFIIVQLLLFLLGCLKYQYGDSFTLIRSELGYGFVFARSAALVLHLNTGIVMLPMCRNLVSYLRISRLVHIGAHYYNFWLLQKLNPNNPGTNWVYLSFISGPGWTGHVMLLALLLMFLTAWERIKRKYFELFWYTHHLFAVYFGLFSIHGMFCLIKPDRPPYCGDGGSFWKYWILSGVLYLTERIIREVRGFQDTTVSKVVLHPSKVVEIQIKKEGIKTQAGQYIFLNCPEVSLHQWHPFTLTSAPEEDYISVHVRVIGNFTTALAKRLGCDIDDKDGDDHVVNSVLPRIQVDGPFGSASEDVFNFEVAVLVGAGIGVTPFASVLKSIWYRVNYPTKQTRLSKVYFFWICRDKEAFEWFQDLLKAIEAEDILQFIEIHTYLTGRIKADEVANIILNDEQGRMDAVTGLRASTNYGRPNLDQIFSGLCHLHPGTEIGVFFCGPLALSNQLYFFCNKYNQPVADGTKFHFGKENF
ncbi:hypothetical protein CONCODRAFT_4967 [Conidiobolus coronatus NRRL 28638]|uniref:FAD-binding FR-type domain-containing protein n=1 Tax=Conidiobolus coronatus (strain ATCC 28846 / CBS 209.66 / NRRL 28638) TaxID=796925 RepID=A0A137PB40_CONC2|nr:hypothetical protein CONCODRAFT_4967 [Conidiobolus coronatus NRRL 28638]|eukprot:KXN72223.1 hypothetical protein CONCODRAFT_4967 [Conidiobolus coronatus NRRL 28638]